LEDARAYRAAGANHYAVSTLLFNPMMFGILYMDYSKLQNSYKSKN
jgi:hypothetical protein